MNIGENVKLINNVIYSSVNDAATGLNFSDSLYDGDMIYKVMNIVLDKDGAVANCSDKDTFDNMVSKGYNMVAVAIGDGSEIFGYEPFGNLQVVREKHM